MSRSSLFATVLPVLVLFLVFAPTASATKLKVPSAQFPTIQSAVTAAQVGDVIQIKKGVYAETVEMLSKSQLRISAKKGAIIDNGSTAIGLSIALSNSIVVSGLTVRHAVPGAFTCTASDDVTFSRCTAIDAGSAGFTFDDGSAARVLNCRVDGADTGVFAFVNGLLVRGCRFQNSEHFAATLVGHGITFDRNSVEGVVDIAGIVIGDGGPNSATSVVMSANRVRGVRGNGIGIRLNGARNCAVNDNEIEDCDGIGVDTENSNGVQIERNRIHDVGGAAVALTTANSVVNANVIRDPGAEGILLTLDADLSLVSGNSIRDAGTYGVRIAIGCDSATLTDNVVKKSGNFDLFDEGNDTALIDNGFGTVAP